MPQGTPDADELSETQREAIEWAKRNNLQMFYTEQSHGVQLQIKLTEYRSIFVGPYNNVDLQERMPLGGEGGEVRFGEKQMTVVNDRGQRHYVSNKKWPL